jgi:hypothetical protein
LVDGDRVNDRVIVAETSPIAAKCARLLPQVVPFGIAIEWRDESGRLGVFRGGRTIGELQIVEARFVSQKFRLIAARFLA